MSHYYSRLALCLGIFLPFFSIAQPEIISLAPNAALPGETINVAITGDNTNFQQGQTILNMGPGIQVLDVQVNHALFLTALVRIEETASPGFNDLTVTTNFESVSLPQAFEILEPGGAVNVVLAIIPVQTLYLSDLNPNNPADNPLLFTITLYNDNQERDLRVVYFLSNEEFGAIGSAEKLFNNMQPFGVEVFDNRQFDDYDLDPASPELLNIAAETGVMPAGAYTYTVLVYDENGNVIAQDEGVNIITNENTIIDLIGPGLSLDQSPGIVASPTPFFQWFSTLNNFDFALYEVNEGQESANDITSNLPVYEETGISASFLQYPPSAEILEENKIYAWQVTSTLQGSQGAETVYSEVFWFQVGDGSGSGYHLSILEVSPEVVNLASGQSHQFAAIGYDQNGEQVPVNCNWSVVPSTAGSVDPDGYFTAGSNPGAAAIMASCGGLQAYGTATITWSVTDQFFDVNLLFDQVFGLQPQN